MDYIDKIEIRITNLNKSMELFIIPSTMKVYFKGTVKDIDSDTLDKFLSIICKWDYEYIDDSVIDAEIFKIRVYTNSGVDEYFGSGKYPKDYNVFKNIVGSICE